MYLLVDRRLWFVVEFLGEYFNIIMINRFKKIDKKIENFIREIKFMLKIIKWKFQNRKDNNGN